MFNNGLANLKENGKYQEILDKYLASEEKESTVDESTIWGLLQNNYQELLKGLGVTIALALISFAIAMVIGIIFGMFSVSPYKPLRWIAEIFVDVIRGIPLMIVAAFIFWGIPNLIESMTGQQSPINAFVAGTIALSLNAGAYIAEIVRGVFRLFQLDRWKPAAAWGFPTQRPCARLSCHRQPRLCCQTLSISLSSRLRIQRLSQLLDWPSSSKQVRTSSPATIRVSGCMLS